MDFENSFVDEFSVNDGIRYVYYITSPEDGKVYSLEYSNPKDRIKIHRWSSGLTNKIIHTINEISE